jgi:hypothetical protein
MPDAESRRPPAPPAPAGPEIDAVGASGSDALLLIPMSAGPVRPPDAAPLSSAPPGRPLPPVGDIETRA